MTTNQKLSQNFDAPSKEQDGNFYFVRKFDPLLYGKLLSIENQSLVNLIGAGAELREALEYFQQQALPNDMISKFHHSNIQQHKDRHSNWIKPFHYERLFKQHPEIGVDAALFSKVRKVGNAFHHIPNHGPNSNLPPRTYETLCQALESLQILLFEYYKKNYPEAFIGHKSIIYEPNRQPIAGYWIYSSIKTADGTACERQMLCYRPDDRDPKLMHYRLLRQYRSADTTEEALRDEKVLRNLWLYQGLQKPRNIVRYNMLDVRYEGEEKEKEEKVILCYDFGGDRPYPLNDNTVSILTEEQKYLILYDMAYGVKELHQIGIYHRNLQPNSVYIFFDQRSNLVEAKLVSFEYAKITNDSVTVLENVQGLHKNPSPYFSATMLAAIQHPEASKRLNWEKEDIYSLGALFHLLLIGKPPIRGNVASNLFKQTHSKIAELIQRMLHRQNNMRPEIAEICDTLNPLYYQIRKSID